MARILSYLCGEFFEHLIGKDWKSFTVGTQVEIIGTEEGSSSSVPMAGGLDGNTGGLLNRIALKYRIRSVRWFSQVGLTDQECFDLAIIARATESRSIRLARF